MKPVLNLILSHQPAGAVSKMLTHWNQCVPSESMLIAYGGTKSEFDAILHRQKFFVEDPRLLIVEGADLLAFHVHRVDGSNNPHVLYYAAEDKFMSYWSRCGRDLQQLRTFLQAYGFLRSKVLRE